MSQSRILSTHPLLSDRVRLSIMGVLASAAVPVSFNEIIEALELSKGNLSTHIKKLEEEGLVLVDKKFIDRKPRTTFECTPMGRAALKQYLEEVQKLLTFSK